MLFVYQGDIAMCHDYQDALWRAFAKTLPEFEAQFASEEACRAYLAECRWNGSPRCKRCTSAKVWRERGGSLYECGACGHQTSLTSGTLFHGTRKPLKLWFRAIWEVAVRRNGISAADLQRILGLGSYQTAWTWLHRIRRAMVSENREKLAGYTQIDETLVGGKGSEKEMVLVVAEEYGRIRLIHVPGNHEAVISHVVDTEIGDDASIKTDGHAAYNARSLDKRAHEAKVQSKAELRQDDHVQFCHWSASSLKQWLLATHNGAVRAKHLQSYLDEHAFRYNRRKTKGVGRLVARCLENMLARTPMTMRQLIDDTQECRLFAGVSY
jgi:Zn ribbon nucleic-acid-binding protein